MAVADISPFRQLIRAYSALLNISNNISLVPDALHENRRVLVEIKNAAPDLQGTEKLLSDIKDAVLALKPPEIPEPIIIQPTSKPTDLFDRMGFSLLLDETSIVDKTVIETNTWEPEQLAYFAGLVERFRGKSGTMFLDIGSYWGLYSLLTLRAGVFEKMYAFDADRHNFAQLQANLFLNDATHSITTFNKALSDKPGKLQFWDSRSHPNKNRAGVGVLADNSEWPTYEVDAITIDSVVTTSGGHLLMKVDVEGHEESVLRGMKQTVATNKVVMQIEVFEQQHERVFAEVNRLGLRQIHSIFPDYYLTNMTPDELGI
jgi:FkbM family methyltransferase